MPDDADAALLTAYDCSGLSYGQLRREQLEAADACKLPGRSTSQFFGVIRPIRRSRA
jgi:hypothetical protein